MADLRTELPGIIARAAHQALIRCMGMGKCRTASLAAIEAKGAEFVERARGGIFLPSKSPGETRYYIWADKARLAAPLTAAQEPPLYTQISDAGHGFALESWLTEALTHHFSTVASILVFFGAPALVLLADRGEGGRNG